MNYMTMEKLEALLSGIDGARVALIGDFCLDVYWTADMKQSELSRETPHFPLPVVSERYSPGGAGNVACNVMALKPSRFIALGAVGEDWRGEMLIRALSDAHVDCGRLVRSPELVTNTYIKPLRTGISHVVYEDPRIDFENRSPMSEALNVRMLAALAAAEDEFDVLLVSDQMKYGCISPQLRQRISQMGQAGKTVIVDSRDHIADYRHVIVKPNEVEAARAFGGGEGLALETLKTLVCRIAVQNAAPAIITVGDQGCLVHDQGETVHVPARRVPPPIDIVGAGDTFLAALGCAVAGGATLCDAARLAAMASSITIKKIGTTGTASRDELWEAARV